MKFQYSFLTIIALVIINLTIIYFTHNRRLDLFFKKKYPQFKFNDKKYKQTRICVLVALKNELVYDAILSLEKNKNMSYDYTLFLGYDNDDVRLENDIIQLTKTIHVNHVVLPVYNPLKKPGPVFNFLSLCAYEYGCDYIYRINDDTEIIGNEWSHRFIDSLLSFKPPNIGVVGPTCHEGNTEILTHDFVHRSHLEIFQEHYPVNLTDWWLDDWISNVYGPEHTMKLTDIIVKHHLQSTRYNVTFSNRDLLQILLNNSKNILNVYIQKLKPVESSLTGLATDNNELKDDYYNGMCVNTLLRNGVKIKFENMSSPVFITFINYGFKNMFANFFCNLQHVMPYMLQHSLIVIVDSVETAQWLHTYNKNIVLYIYKSFQNDKSLSLSSHFGSTEYQSIMMMRGQALLEFLGKGIPVIWIEPDAVYYEDLLMVKELIHPTTDFVFFDDNSIVGGGFIRFPGNDYAKTFYQRVLTLAETQFGKNDQLALNAIKHEVSFSVLDTCLFRSGIFAADPLPNGGPRLKDCDNKKVIVQQLNYVVGLENKIKLAQSLNSWYVDDVLMCKYKPNEFNQDIVIQRTNSIIPTILIGIMITEHTSVERLNAFRQSFSNVSSGVQLVLKFVQGKSLKSHVGTDIVVLNISENLDEGKTFYWLKYGAEYLSNFAQYHELNGIVKMDIDCAVNWNDFAKSVFVQLKPNYYVGRVNDFNLCGGGSHCPPYSCHDFKSDCWIYMSGGWYALSYDLTNYLIFNCKYSSQNIIGFEDLMVGKWIKNCFKDTFVYSVKNGDYFCHDNSVTDQDILHFNNKQCLK